MGKGRAQLGKAVKGRSKERVRDKQAELKDAVTDKQLSDDIRQLEEYEKLAKLQDAHKIRLKRIEQREDYNTKINQKLVLNIHRQTMRAEKAENLRNDIDVLAETHARDVQRKDEMIRMLFKDLDDAEEQMQTAQRAHMAKIAALEEIHHQKMTCLTEEFERDLKVLKHEFNTEMQHAIATHAKEIKEMNAIIAAVEAEETGRVTREKQSHENEREMIRNKNLESINELRINLENKIEDLERMFDEAHQNYVDKTDQANRHFKELEREDRRLSRRIRKKKERIDKLQAQLLAEKKKLENTAKECAARNTAIREQKEAVLQHCNALKERMKRMRTSQARRLTELVVLSRDALLANESQLTRAEKLLQLAELSRKLETEREKVVPFYSSSVPSQLNHDEDEAKLEGRMDNTSLFVDGTPVGEWNHLDNFYKKYNKVLLDKLAIGREQERLAKVRLSVIPKPQPTLLCRKTMTCASFSNNISTVWQ